MNQKPKRGEKINMKKLKEVLRHHQKLKFNNEKTAFCVGVSKGSVHNILQKYKSLETPYVEVWDRRGTLEAYPSS